MKLICLGSSSSGNGYILKSESGACLLIEAGVPLMEVKKALDFNLSGIAGCVVSHSHGDHSGYIKEYISAGLTVCNEYIENRPFNLDEFRIMAFPVIHDVPCHGFLIQHPESGLIVFITDTHYSPFKFPGVSHWLVEANYDQEILDNNILNGRIPQVVRNRIMKSHMSLQTCKELLEANDLTPAKNIVLLHLSDGNSNASAFKSEVEGLTGKPVFIADKGLKIDLNIKPF